MDAEVVMPSARRTACVAFACLLSGAPMTSAGEPIQAPQPAPAPVVRGPLTIVERAPVDVPPGLNPALGRVQVQLDAVVAADGTVSDVRLFAVNLLAEKVEFTADPAALQSDFAAMTKAASASLRQWRFAPPADA